MDFHKDRLFIYSDTSRVFLNRARLYLKNILSAECGVELKSTRFLYKSRLVPISLVVFEKGRELGFCDYGRFQIGLSKRLIYQASESTIQNILKHEIAHLFTFLDYGQSVSAHGKEFHEVCQRFFNEPSIKDATHDLATEDQLLAKEDETDKVIQKIKKLMALASSSNSHESALATSRANELLLRHNLDLLYNSGNKLQEDTYMRRVLSSKKHNSKLSAILKILETFYVKPIMSYGRGNVAIEVIGIKVNVDLAEYVANFLDGELERLYKIAKKENPQMQGLRAKNSFLNGVAEGYLEKIAAVNQHFKGSRELVLIKNDLETRLHTIYPRLSSVSSSQQRDHLSAEIGKSKGKNLNIHKGVSNNSSHTFYLS